nr:uncharacterized mitochondrial protein AtMg00810-like [Tanacetum cinerariifolium]
KASDYDNPDPVAYQQDVSSLGDAHVPSQQELDLLFGPWYDEFFNAEEGEQLPDDELTNSFCTPAQEDAESSSHNLGNSNVPTYLNKFVEIHQGQCKQDDNLQQILKCLDADLSGNPVDQTDYRSKIGSLMYLTSSRPDIVQAVCFCARYQSQPTEKHLKEVKRIFRYLRGTVNMGLWYSKGSIFGLTAFLDADHVGCIDSHKSTSGGIQFLGDKLVSWMSKKQNYTAMSSTKAVYVSLFSCCAQVMWIRTQLQDYGFNYNKIPLYCDSQSVIAISCNLVQHSRTKHIHTRRSYALSWKPCQGDSLNLPDHMYSIYTIKQETEGLDDDVAASFQQSQIHHHMFMLKLPGHTEHQDSRFKKAQS